MDEKEKSELREMGEILREWAREIDNIQPYGHWLEDIVLSGRQKTKLVRFLTNAGLTCDRLIEINK